MSRQLSILFRVHKTFIVSTIFLVLFSFAVSYAAPLYTPGQTLNPTCAPGTTNCTVAISGSSSPWTVSGNNVYYNTGNVGIGTATPAAKLDLEGDGTILALGADGVGTAVPNLGAGTRLMWIPSKSAFRAGSVAGTEWDNTNVGDKSVAFNGGTASGTESFAMDDGAVASGNFSFAFDGGLASGNDSVAFASTASGVASVAFAGGVASGIQSAAFNGGTASGIYSSAFNNSIAAGNYSMSSGFTTSARAMDSAAFGRFNIGGGTINTWVPTDSLFEIGNGDGVTNHTNRYSDAFSVLKNGIILAAGSDSSGPTVPNLGASARLEWIPNASAFRAGTAIGTEWDSGNVGQYSTAIGYDVTAGDWATAIGDTNTASGIDSLALGYSTTASGDDSTALGENTIASSYLDTALGQYNIGGGNATSWIATDPLFEVGNSQSPSSLSDALLILKNGSTGINLAPNTAPNHSLDVGNNTISGIVARFQNSTGTCDINPTTTSLTCSSDMNLKDNINNLSDNSPWSFNTNIAVSNQSILAKVLGLNPVIYNWKTEATGTNKHPGFIAQEVQQVFPNLVATDPTTNLLSLNYTGLIPYTVEAIKEMNVNVTSIDDLTKGNSWRDSLVGWFGDINNGITSFYSKKITSDQITSHQITSDQFCVGTVCITQQQFLQMVQNAGQTPTTAPDTSSSSSDISTQSPAVTPPAVTPPSSTSSDTANETQSPDVTTPPVSTN